MRRSGAVAVVAGILALAGCSAEGGAGRAGRSTKAAEGGATSSPSSTSSTTTATPAGPSRAAYSVAFGDAFVVIDRENRCVAGRMVDAVGLERLHAAEVTPVEFAENEIFTQLGVDEDERAALTAKAAEAMAVCGNAEKLAADHLQADDPEWDFTPYASCVAEPLGPLLAEVVVRSWAGEIEGSVLDETGEALAVADAGCPELQLEATQRAADHAGRSITGSERSCVLARYTEIAAEHRAIEDADTSAVIQACLGG